MSYLNALEARLLRLSVVQIDVYCDKRLNHWKICAPVDLSLTRPVNMTNQEVMVVLSDDGRPVTVIRALDDVISRDQRSLSDKSVLAGARISADVKRNSANR